MIKIQQSEKAVQKKSALDDLVPIKDYEHTGARAEDLKLYTHFKTKQEANGTQGAGSGKVISQDDMMMMFTYMDSSELKDMVTKDKSNGKSGKVERVQYMNKNEVNLFQAKTAKQNQERRLLADGGSKQVSEQQSTSKYLRMINSVEEA